LECIDLRGKVISFGCPLLVGVNIMSGSGSSTLSPSGVGGSNVQGIPPLPEEVVEEGKEDTQELPDLSVTSTL